MGLEQWYQGEPRARSPMRPGVSQPRPPVQGPPLPVPSSGSCCSGWFWQSCDLTQPLILPAPWEKLQSHPPCGFLDGQDLGNQFPLIRGTEEHVQDSGSCGSDTGSEPGWGCPKLGRGSRCRLGLSPVPCSSLGVCGVSLSPFSLTGIHRAPCERLETVWVSWDTSGSPSIPRLSPASH